MGLPISFPYLSIFALALSPAIISSSSLSSQLPTPPALDWQVSLNFPVEGVGQPEGGSAGGGVRGVRPSCVKHDQIPLQTLTPQSSSVEKTHSANPSFFVYVPQTQAKSGEFVVYDDSGNQVYLAAVELNDTPSVVQLQLPETISLEVGKDYRWQFRLSCNLQSQIPNHLVGGVIRRTLISSDLQQKLEKLQLPKQTAIGGLNPRQEYSALLKQAEIYAEAKMWNDTITILARVRNYRPKAWAQMLTSFGLETIAHKPFVECCTQEK
ncbi:MAG: DUF928 domain-containing protein [Symploca sp. SIO1C4]|uniref:DUF928 domain-containing protein n=1 Tax=Symploca sp. SIO1C4 TaxID=2607765 RepID=A0A6B3NDL7_9CYAN|nr:DUF928 domain-containing protein [Symploca sp. SIO1C4]